MSQTVRKSKRPEHECLSYDDFLKNYNAGEHLEWVDGAVIPMSPVTKQHEDARGFLYTIINEYVKMKRLGQVSGEPYNMKISYRLHGVYHSAALPGFWLHTNWLWQNPQPTLLSVLKAWGLA